MQRSFLIVLLCCSYPIVVHQSCRSRSLTHIDIDRHFRTNSKLFFLFGVEIHRPFLNENNQTHADVSLFIVAICESNSTDCLDRRGSLPAEYQLKFSVENRFYTNKFSQIDGQWHRTKKINENFLYGPLNDHGWYDDPDSDENSIWKTWVMNLNDAGNESLHSKWVEFDIQLQDAGIHRIEGEQWYHGNVVQQFEYHFYVPTFRCLHAPSIFFDDFLSTETYLSAFHFHFDSDQCYIQEYSCELHRTKREFINTTYSNAIYNHREIVNITVDYPSESIEPLTKDHLIKGTSLNDHIFERVIVGANFLRYDNDFSLQATCTSINPITKRKFVLCAETTKKNDTFNATDRIDIVICQYVPSALDQCLYYLYDHQFSDHSLLFLPAKRLNITFVGFLRLPRLSPANLWAFSLDESYPKISARQLETSRQHTLLIPSMFDSSSKQLFYSYRIITDQRHLCSFVCERDCTGDDQNPDEFFFRTSSADLIFFCPNCQWILMTELRNHGLVVGRSQLTPDLWRLRIMLFNSFHTMNFTCYQQTFQMRRSIKFHRYMPADVPMCTIETNSIHPYHEQVHLQCELFFTQSEILLWATTYLNDEFVQIWLNPTLLTTEKVQSRRIFKIDGIPHGVSVIIEVRSQMFSLREKYSIKIKEFTEQSIAAIRIAPDGNYFASAFRLIENYLQILKTDLIEFKKPRLISVGLNHTVFLTNLIDYYRLILNYIDQESLDLKTKDFEQIYSTISSQLLQHDSFYLESNLIYRDHFLSLLIDLSSKATLITYDTYHLLRHTVKLIATSLPELPIELLTKLIKLCVQLRLFVLHPSSMPLSTMINSRSLVEFNQMISQILVSIHRQVIDKQYTNIELQRLNDGPFDFLLQQIEPFTTDRWHLTFNRVRSRRTLNNILGIIYYPHEFVPSFTKADATIYVDYQISQLLTIESDQGTPAVSTEFSSISFSLNQTYLNLSTLSQQYFYKIVLNRVATNHYSHSFTFELTSSSRLRNLSLVFLHLSYSKNFTFTTHVRYNDSCRESTFSDDETIEYVFDADLSTNDYFVYSIPVQPMTFVCAQVQIVSKDVPIRESKRTGYFLVLETGCYSFSTTIFDNYFEKLEEDRCQLIDNDQIDSLSFPHLTCSCRPSVTKYLLLCQPKSIHVQFELNAQTWLFFYIYFVILLFLFLVLGFYAIYKDTLDSYKPQIHFVHDNQVPAATVYSYQLTMFTGLQKATSKHLKINVRLIGSNGHDVIHCLNSHQSNLFQRGGIDRFFLTTFVDLGRVIALNVWLTNLSSKSDFYLRHCILYDIHRHRTYYFCCYTWLSMRKRINKINELFYVAQEVDQYAFGHLFLCTYAWLFYHYHSIGSIFNKQRINSLTRIFRLQFYFFVVTFQLFLIQSILLSCRNLAKTQRCFHIFPSFSLLFDQSFVDAGWSTIFQIIRRNFVASLAVGIGVSFITAFLIPLIIWISTLLTDRLEFYRQVIDAKVNEKSFHNLHGFLHVLSSSLVDFHHYQQDTNQFEFMHKFDLQHRISVSTLGENPTESSASINSNAMRSDVTRLSSPMIFKPFFSSSLIENSLEKTSSKLTIDTRQESNISSIATTIKPMKIKYKINWPKLPKCPSNINYRCLMIVYAGFFSIFLIVSIVNLFFVMKIFVKTENYSLTSETIFIHLLTIVFTPICELILIVVVCLLNAVFFQITDENSFVCPIVEIPLISENELERPPLDHSFVLHRDLTLTDQQIRQRIRQRFIESSLIRAVRDVIGYILFLIIIVIVVKETAKNVQTRLAMRQFAVQLLLRDNIFQNIDHLPDTMNWIGDILEKRLFLDRQDYSCTKDTCHFVRIPNSTFYLSKSLRVRQIRLERQICSERIRRKFPSSTCFVGQKNLIKSSSFVIGEQRKCSDVCNYTSIWSAVASREQQKLYDSYESPWFFQMHLSSEETVARCNRRRKYYDLIKNRWFDEKTFVVLIEGNLYSPEAAAMISFVLTIEKNRYGTIDNEVFIEVSDYTLSIVDNQTKTILDSSMLTSENENESFITHYLFALLLFVIFITKMFDFVKYLRNFGFHGFIYLLRTLSNLIDGFLFLLSCYYFLFFYFDRRVFQLHNLRQSLNIEQLFVSFRVLIVNNIILNHLIGFICLVAILKFLDLLKFNPKTFLLAETIYQSIGGFAIILSLAFVNYFIFTLIARLFFSNEKSFESFADAFRLVLTSSIKDATPTDEFIPMTIRRALWQIFLWLFSAKLIEYFLISFVIEKFSKIRKTHQLTDEERIVGRIFETFRNYFAD